MKPWKCKYCQASFQNRKKMYRWFVLSELNYIFPESWRLKTKTGGYLWRFGTGTGHPGTISWGPWASVWGVCAYLCICRYLLTIIYCSLQWDNQEPSEGLVQAADPGGGGVLQRARDSRGRGPHRQPQEDAGECQLLVTTSLMCINTSVCIQNFEDMGSIVRDFLSLYLFRKYIIQLGQIS